MPQISRCGGDRGQHGCSDLCVRGQNQTRCGIVRGGTRPAHAAGGGARHQRGGYADHRWHVAGRVSGGGTDRLLSGKQACPDQQDADTERYDGKPGYHREHR